MFLYCLWAKSGFYICKWFLKKKNKKPKKSNISCHVKILFKFQHPQMKCLGTQPGLFIYRPPTTVFVLWQWGAMTETIWPAKPENIYYPEYLFSGRSLLGPGLIPAPGQPPACLWGSRHGDSSLPGGSCNTMAWQAGWQQFLKKKLGSKWHNIKLSSKSEHFSGTQYIHNAVQPSPLFSSRTFLSSQEETHPPQQLLPSPW